MRGRAGWLQGLLPCARPGSKCTSQGSGAPSSRWVTCASVVIHPLPRTFFPPLTALNNGCITPALAPSPKRNSSALRRAGKRTGQAPTHRRILGSRFRTGGREAVCQVPLVELPGAPRPPAPAASGWVGSLCGHTWPLLRRAPLWVECSAVTLKFLKIVN